MPINPKLVLITGASSGIGEACAKVYAEQGYHLIITGRRSDRLQALGHSLESEFDTRVHILNFDIRDKQQVSTQLDSLPADLRRIDVLINNAGLSQGLEPLQEGDFLDWDTMIDTNIKGLLYVSKIVSNWMINNKAGHIVNLGSIAGKEVYQNGNVYCATKHAVDALTKAMRIDLVEYKIKVTAVNPGAVETEFSEIRFHGDKEKARKVYEGFQPLLAQDIAETIYFVTSRPFHVNINDLTIMPTAQASAFYWSKVAD